MFNDGERKVLFTSHLKFTNIDAKSDENFMNMDEKRIKSYKYIIKLIFQALILKKAYKIKSRGLQKVNKNVDFMLKV